MYFIYCVPTLKLKNDKTTIDLEIIIEIYICCFFNVIFKLFTQSKLHL